MPDNNIAILRRKAGMSQKELGESLGVVQTTVSGWESGKNKPDMSLADKMAKLFKVSIGSLMGYEPIKLHEPLSPDEIVFNVEMAEHEDDDSEQAEYEAWREKQRKITMAFVREEYLKSGLGIYFEAYLINLAFDNMTRYERNRLVSIAQSAFPKAFNFLEDED